MKFEFTPKGNLVLVAEPTDTELLGDLLQRHGGDDVSFLADLLETTGWSPNGQLMQLSPEDVGALTDAPILTDDRTIDDDGVVSAVGKVWWYPNYMVTNFAEELAQTGSTQFQLACAA